MSGLTEARRKALGATLAGLKTAAKGRAVLPPDEVNSILAHVQAGFAKLEEELDRFRESTDPHLGGWPQAAERHSARLEIRRTEKALKHAKAILPLLGEQRRVVGDEQLLYLERTDKIREALGDLISQLEGRMGMETSRRRGGRDRENQWQEFVVTFAARCCKSKRVTTTVDGPFVILVATLCEWVGRRLGPDGAKVAVQAWLKSSKARGGSIGV